MEGFRLKRIDELASINHGAVKLAGAELGVQSFGLQVLDLPPGFIDYPEHDHSDDGQEEVYVVLEGSAHFEVAGERFCADAGSMLWVGADSRRRIEGGVQGVRILAIGCRQGGSYERPEDFRLAART
jgi:mannose-6-phosphate isomerase-like protein (cupin superfamily)